MIILMLVGIMSETSLFCSPNGCIKRIIQLDLLPRNKRPESLVSLREKSPVTLITVSRHGNCLNCLLQNGCEDLIAQTFQLGTSKRKEYNV